MHNNLTANILKKLVIVLIVMTPVGILIMLNSALRDKFLWTTTIFLTLQFITLLLYLFLNYNYKSVVFAIPTLLICGFMLEYVGVKTTYPFGSYAYTDTLQPQLLNVPIAISLSWVVVVVSSYLIAARGKTSKTFSLIVSSAILVLGIDLLLEPFASFINFFWIWGKSTVPVQNYVSWFFAGLIFSYLLKIILKEESEYENASKIISNTPLIVYMINVIQFIIINLANNYIIMTLSGLILISLTIMIIYRNKNEI